MRDALVNFVTHYPQTFFVWTCVALGLGCLLALRVIRLRQQLARERALRVIDQRQLEVGFSEVLIQADCLRHYSRVGDTRSKLSRAFPTVGEVQAGHFEDIAVRYAPNLNDMLHRLRESRAVEQAR